MSDTTDGIELTDQIIKAVKPIVDGQSTETVIEAFAAAMMTLLAASHVGAFKRRKVLYEYAECILDFAENLD